MGGGVRAVGVGGRFKRTVLVIRGGVMEARGLQVQVGLRMVWVLHLEDTEGWVCDGDVFAVIAVCSHVLPLDFGGEDFERPVVRMSQPICRG